MGAGLLPVTIHQGVNYLLIGKEFGSKQWADFGGGREKGESLFDTAFREGVEELNGFLGTETEMRRAYKQNGIGVITTPTPIYKCYVLYVEYDKQLPIYFNNNFKLMKRNLMKEVVQHNGLFEKSEIRWVTLPELKKMNMRNYFKHDIYPALGDFLSNYNV
jgi:8-oxo-dGTP pyrophosphatase MutT (NUDIX family)